MILIEDVIISDAVVEEDFVCNLSACKGGCCVKVDSGAPLEAEETQWLKEHYRAIEKHITPEGRQAIKEQGVYVRSTEKVSTPLIDNKACAYVCYEKGVAQCGIEKANEQGDIGFQKPISCHLYPIRITKTDEMEFVNYEEWDICSPACKLGGELKVPVYKFLKNALIRKYGTEFYEALEATQEHLSRQA